VTRELYLFNFCVIGTPLSLFDTTSNAIVDLNQFIKTNKISKDGNIYLFPQRIWQNFHTVNPENVAGIISGGRQRRIFLL